MVFKRIGREWVVVIAAFFGAAFSIGDGAGWIEFLTGYNPEQKLVVSGVFILFAIIVIIRLVKLQKQLDEFKERKEIRITLDNLIGEGNKILSGLPNNLTNLQDFNKYSGNMNKCYRRSPNGDTYHTLTSESLKPSNTLF